MCSGFFPLVILATFILIHLFQLSKKLLDVVPKQIEYNNLAPFASRARVHNDLSGFSSRNYLIEGSFQLLDIAKHFH